MIEPFIARDYTVKLFCHDYRIILADDVKCFVVLLNGNVNVKVLGGKEFGAPANSGGNV